MSDPQANRPSNLPAISGTQAASPAAATQLKDLSLHELQTMARDFGLDPESHDTKPGLVAAILDRRTMIASLDRDAMIDVLQWAGRPITASMSRDHIAMEITHIRSMRFNGLSQRGLTVLAKMRGITIRDTDATPDIIAALKGQEGLFAKLGRKRRQMVGKWVSRMLGETPTRESPKIDPVEAAGAGRSDGTASRPAASPTNASTSNRKLHEEIEESGLIAGLTSRVRRTADQYLNQKLDEIEARIDRKLDEIDRRLAEWRDKEVANRIRILKVSLWATVVVGGATLIISYIRVHMPWIFGG